MLNTKILTLIGIITFLGISSSSSMTREPISLDAAPGVRLNETKAAIAGGSSEVGGSHRFSMDTIGRGWRAKNTCWREIHS